MKHKTAVVLTVSVILIIAAVVCIVIFGKGSGDSRSESVSQSETETTAVPVAESESETEKKPETVFETEKEPETVLSEWDRATMIWKAGTELRFELRVKPGFEYELKPDDDNCGCTFRTKDGKTVHILIQGLDYENTFDLLIAYFNNLHPEKLSVGDNTKTIIIVYNGSDTEICSKITDMLCLTTKAPDVETAEYFFSSVMIKAEGEDYYPLDLSDIYNEI